LGKDDSAMSQIKEAKLLDAIGSDPSFEILEFLERISISEDWAKLIVAQIYLDHIITETIKDQLLDSDAFLGKTSSRKNFHDKLSLCNALGFFTEHVGDAIRAVNSCRNKFAHQLVFEVSEADKQKILDNLRNQRKASELDAANGFTNLLLSIVLTAEAERALQKRKKKLDTQKGELMERLFELLSVNA